MIASGVEAVIIKVAGIGLNARHLGQTIAQMQPTLKRLVRVFLAYAWSRNNKYYQNELYGAHICGEGGEYETLTLDCSLFKRRLVLYGAFAFRS